MLAQREAATFLHAGGVAKSQKVDGDTVTGCSPECHQAQQQESQSLWDTELGNDPQGLHPSVCQQNGASCQEHERKPKVQCGKWDRGARFHAGS